MHIWSNPSEKIIEKMKTPGNNVHVSEIVLAVLGYTGEVKEGKTVNFSCMRLATPDQMTTICSLLKELTFSGDRLVPDDDLSDPEVIKYHFDDKTIKDHIDDDEFRKRLDKILGGKLTINSFWALYRIACYYRKRKIRWRIVIAASAILLGIVAYKVISWIRADDDEEWDEDEWEMDTDEVVTIDDESIDLDDAEEADEVEEG